MNTETLSTEEQCETCGWVGFTTGFVFGLFIGVILVVRRFS